MKNKTVVIVVMFVISLLPADGQPFWAGEHRVTYSAGIQSLLPTATARGIVVHHPKSAHILYVEKKSASEGGVYYGFSTNQGKNWQKVLISPVPPPKYPSWLYWYPALDVARGANGEEKVHIVYLYDFEGNGQGAVWYRVLPNGAMQLTPPDVYAAKAPVVAVNNNGVVLAAWLWNIGNTSLRYRRSADGGLTWGPEQLLYESPGQAGLIMPVTIDFADNQTVHASWLVYATGRIRLMYRRSTDAGLTWERPLEIWSAPADSPEDELTGERGPTIAANTAGRVVISWVHSWLPTESNTFSVFALSSSDGGNTWGEAVELVAKHRNLMHPSAACDERGVAYVVWMDSSNDGRDIYFSRSVSSNHWSKPEQLTFSSASAEMPCVAVDERNTLHIVFKDNRTGDDEIYSKWGLQMFSDRFDATGFNQQRNIVMPPLENTSERHIVYWDDGIVYYTYSSDKGSSWCLPETVGIGTYPTLVLGEDYQPRVAYLQEGSIIFAARDATGKWTRRNIFLGLPPDCWADPPVMAFSGSAFIAYGVHERLPGKTNAPPTRNYIYFSEVTSAGIVLPPVILEEQTGNILNQPAIAVTPASPSPFVHVVWNKDQQIWYRVRENGEWSERLWVSFPDTIPNPPIVAEPADNPFIESCGDSVYAVWHGPNLGGAFPGEIWKRKKFAYSSHTPWEDLRCQSESPDQESDYPVQTSADVTVWMERLVSENWDLYLRYQEQMPRVLIVSSGASRFPSCVSGWEMNAQGRFFWHNYCWTEELRSDLFEVRYDREVEAPSGGGGGQSVTTVELAGPLKLTVAPAVMRDRFTINLDLPSAGRLKIGLYDQSGRRVQSVYDGLVGAGKFTIVTTCQQYPAGVYFLGAHLADRSAVIKLVISQ